MSYIKLNGVTMHNLKNIDVKFPKNKISVITGVSGSGKSTIAFDTVYKEGQFRYIESLSTYLRMFFSLGDRPSIQYTEGLSPAIAIEQNKRVGNIRSTLGTLTECDDFLRLSFAKMGNIYCPECGDYIKSKTVLELVDSMLKIYKDQKVQILSSGVKLSGDKSLAKYLRRNRRRIDDGAGYTKILITDEEGKNLDTYFYLEEPTLSDFPVKAYGIYDKFTVNKENKARLEEDLIKLFGEQDKIYISVEGAEEIKPYTIYNYCANCDIRFPEYSPAHFTPNRIEGACEECKGLGETLQVDLEAIVDTTQTVKNAIIPWRDSNIGQAIVTKIMRKYDYDIKMDWEELPDDIKHILLHGDGELLKLNMGGSYISMYYEGIEKLLTDQYHKGMLTSDIRSFVRFRTCPSCDGKKLNDQALAVKLLVPKTKQEETLYTISELQEKPIKDLFGILKLFYKKSTFDKELKKRILTTLIDRLETIIELGLGHLSLSRRVNTLSGGEIQRLRLAKQLGNRLTGIIYVLDEPTIGLDEKETLNTIEAVKKLKKIGNTIIVVEHNKNFIKNADWIIEVGPGAGDFGGNVVFEGKIDDFMKSDTLTAKYMNGEKTVDVDFTHKHTTKKVSIRKANRYNLTDIDVDIPLGGFTIVTGGSGAGKTTLMYKILYKFFQDKEKFIQGHIRLKLLQKGYSWTDIISRQLIAPQDYAKYEQEAITKFYDELGVDRITGWQDVKNVVYIDQTSIGKNPRSCPSTFIGVFDDIRKIYGSSHDAKLLGMNISYFSFNSKKGACPECKGYGYKKIELQFLPDTYVECDLCKGKRYRPEILQIKWNGKSIYELLNMYIKDAYEFFKDIPYIRDKLEMLVEIGLGYLKMGQPAHTLSGGESQRLKIVKNLIKSYKGHTMYFLDEPTVGLHPDDIGRLLLVLKKFLNKGDTILMIEHDKDLLRFADNLIRLEDGKIVK